MRAVGGGVAGARAFPYVFRTRAHAQTTRKAVLEVFSELLENLVC